MALETFLIEEEPNPTDSQVFAWVRGEWLFYFLILVGALFLRLAELDTVPLQNTEAQQALIAWRHIFPFETSQELFSSQPLVFWSQVIPFSILGATEWTARIGTVFASCLLILTPILFRSLLTGPRSLILSFLLAILPTFFVASRSGSGMIWVLLFAMLTLWALWQFWLSELSKYALFASASFAAMTFLSSSGGLLLGLIALIAFLLALWFTILSAPVQLSKSGHDILDEVKTKINSFPKLPALLTMVLTIIIGATGFFIYPQGLTMVAQLVTEFLGSWFNFSSNSAPIWSILIVYEPLLIVFSLFSIAQIVKRGEITFIERFIIFSIFVAFAFTFLFANSDPALVLIVSLPLAAISSYTISSLFINYATAFFWVDENDTNPPSLFSYRFHWAKWLIATVIYTLLLTFSFHLLEIARSITKLPLDSTDYNIFLDPRFLDLRYSLVWTIILVLFMAISFFLAASIWGNTLTYQGFGVALFLFMITTSLATAWHTSVGNEFLNAELWYPQRSTQNTQQLSTTFRELSRRVTGGFDELEVAILDTDNALSSPYGILAWILRNNPNVRFVNTLSEVKQTPIVILPFEEPSPDLGGSYVGQSFLLSQQFKPFDMLWQDIPAWLGQRKTPAYLITDQGIILWVRMDVYDGSLFEDVSAG